MMPPIIGETLRVWFLSALVVHGAVAGNPDAKRLYDDLLSNYNKLVRPVVNTSDVLRVCIKLKLSQLIDVVSTILFVLFFWFVLWFLETESCKSKGCLFEGTYFQMLVRSPVNTVRHRNIWIRFHYSVWIISIYVFFNPLLCNNELYSW